MSRTEHKTIQLIRTILTEHESFWTAQLPELRRYKNVYQNMYWQGKTFSDGMLRIETSEGFSYIEGFMASLFSRAPAVEIGPDEASRGDAELAESLANRFLVNQRRAIENASRMALIYPCSFLKLAPTSSTSLLDKIAIRAIDCWEVIVDRDASAWDEQRFTGHVYYISIPEAKERFGNRDFTGIQKVDYFNPQIKTQTRKSVELPEEYLYIQVIELYDMLYDSLYFWSPQYSNGDKLLDKASIPVRTFDDKPLAPIVPVYYSRIPDSPLIGMSAMSRIYDQITEKNNLRTYMANAVRRDSRQWIYRKDNGLDEESLAKISAGQDGAMIAIGADKGELTGLIIPVPNIPISSDHDRYLSYIEQDIARGSILAPFTRGEATNATATEITALAQYSASEIGKLARDRDEAIELIAMIYLRILSFNAEEGDKAVILVDGKAKVVTPEDLDAKFNITALDQGYQPLSDAIEKQNLVQLLPILTQLGVPADKIREEIVRKFQLPDSFNVVVAPTPTKPVGPNSIPDESSLSTEPTEQVSDPQDLADSLTRFNQ